MDTPKAESCASSIHTLIDVGPDRRLQQSHHKSRWCLTFVVVVSFLLLLASCVTWLATFSIGIVDLQKNLHDSKAQTGFCTIIQPGYINTKTAVFPVCFTTTNDTTEGSVGTLECVFESKIRAVQFVSQTPVGTTLDCFFKDQTATLTDPRPDPVRMWVNFALMAFLPLVIGIGALVSSVWSFKALSLLEKENSRNPTP